MLPHPVTGLIAALNHLLQGNEWARQRLMPHAGRRACIEMPPFEIGLAVTPDGNFERLADAASACVTISLPADAPFRLLGGFDKLMSTARVAGNAEFATELSFVFRNLRWDAEEDLSRIVGDVAAQRMVKTTSGVLAWQRQAAGNLADNVSEYLAMENPWLAPRQEFEAFRADLIRLDAAISRLETRLRR